VFASLVDRSVENHRRISRVTKVLIDSHATGHVFHDRRALGRRVPGTATVKGISDTSTKNLATFELKRLVDLTTGATLTAADKAVFMPNASHNVLSWPLLKKQGWRCNDTFTRMHPPGQPENYLEVRENKKTGLWEVSVE
jgi:hypothetical protein